MKRKALGRGLGALIPDGKQAEGKGSARRRGKGRAAGKAGSGPGGDGSRDYFNCPIERVHPAGWQPRQHFDDERLAALADSIRAQGVVQPLVVRPGDDGDYVIIAGERRWRAAQRAGLHEVPVVIREVSDRVAMEMALVENLQREDLNPIEEAEALGLMLDEHGYTQKQLAERLGRDRTTITNTLRLRKLPGQAREALVAGKVTAGHARALLGLENHNQLLQALRKVMDAGLSVRQTENLVKAMRERGGGRKKKSSGGQKQSANVRALQDRLTTSLKTRVRLVGKGNRGKIEISYGSLDELDRILEVLLEE